MAHWFASLSWSEAALIAICLGWGAVIGFFTVLVLLSVCMPQGRSSHARADTPESASDADPWPVVDYAPRYAEKTAWLGDRHLLARPLRRGKIAPGSDTSVGSVIQFDRGRR